MSPHCHWAWYSDGIVKKMSLVYCRIQSNSHWLDFKLACCCWVRPTYRERARKGCCQILGGGDDSVWGLQGGHVDELSLCWTLHWSSNFKMSGPEQRPWRAGSLELTLTGCCWVLLTLLKRAILLSVIFYGAQVEFLAVARVMKHWSQGWSQEVKVWMTLRAWYSHETLFT